MKIPVLYRSVLVAFLVVGGAIPVIGLLQLSREKAPTRTWSHEVFKVDDHGNIKTTLSAEDIFVDPDHGDFRLKPGSPAVGGAVPLTEVTTDLEGKPRDPNRPSIGAFEAVEPPLESAPVNGGLTDMTLTQIVLWCTLLTNLVSLVVSFTIWRSVSQKRWKLLRERPNKKEPTTEVSILDLIVKDQEK